ncbi:MAG: dihydroneopterin aldolase [Chloroflexi bacterium]|nr:dihydroneopterin aldolase [Chloroflexota bacterium]
MTDAIRLNDIVLYGYHGVLPEEQKLGQRFIVNVEISVDLRKVGESDDLTQTVDYAEILELIKAIVAGPPQHLIESVAERIAAAVLEQFPLADAVSVSVRKPSVPIADVVLGSSEVQIHRTRSSMS